jgi:hypothetical protein
LCTSSFSSSTTVNMSFNDDAAAAVEWILYNIETELQKFH